MTFFSTGLLIHLHFKSLEELVYMLFANLAFKIKSEIISELNLRYTNTSPSLNHGAPDS